MPVCIMCKLHICCVSCLSVHWTYEENLQIDEYSPTFICVVYHWNLLFIRTTAPNFRQLKQVVEHTQSLYQQNGTGRKMNHRFNQNNVICTVLQEYFSKNMISVVVIVNIGDSTDLKSASKRQKLAQEFFIHFINMGSAWCSKDAAIYWIFND